MKRISRILMAALLVFAVRPVSIAREKPAAERMRPALLVIDIQNAYLPMMAEEDKHSALYLVNAAIDLFRSRGFPVIRVYHTDPKFGPPQGSPEFEFPSSVFVKPEDPMIVKNYGNAFKKTSLDGLLRGKGVNTVFLCGLSAVGCVLATYHGAVDLDYETFLVKGALLSHNAALTRSVQEICETVGHEAVRLMLENAVK